MLPTIVIIAFNRPSALSRILDSIHTANYAGYKDIRLIISIDGGGDKNQEVIHVAESFKWVNGKKEVITYKDNLGLRKHVINCGDLTEKYEYLIVLEEDCFVSRNYYDFAVKSLSFYALDKRIAGISLYTYLYNENAETLFIPIADGFDTYFLQVPSSLGQVWTKAQWQGFKAYYNTNPILVDTDKIPEKVKMWPECSWKKYFYKYMVEKNLFFVYPQIAFSTNFGDKGTNFSTRTQLYQVELENCDNRWMFNFSLFDNSNNKYDAYFELLPECFAVRGLNIDIDTCIDIMGSKPFSLFDNQYALSAKQCINPIKSFDNVLIPGYMNVFYQLDGTSIHYAELKNFENLQYADKVRQIENLQQLGFLIGEKQVMIGKYYKLGFYLMNPVKIFGLIKRKILK